MNHSRSSFAVVFVITFLSLIVLGSTLAYGQAISGNVVGTVVDSSGAAVTNADLEAKNLGTGITTSTTTNATGGYRFENLPVGTYAITAKSKGFKTVVQQVDVVLNKTGTLNVTLTPGATNEMIEVSGVAVTIDTSSAQLESSYDERMAKDLSITSAGGLGAGVLNLSLLSPGVTQVSSLGLGVGPSVGGQRPRDNNFTVEGVDNNNKTVTGALISVPNDAVDNFTLLANQFNTEFGHSSGGQFNTTIKSGTNSFHGSVYEYFRNRNLNAIDNFYVLQGLTSNPRFDSNRYGGTFGGPIIKNKLFFFTNFERQPVGFTATSGAQVFAPTGAGLAAIQADPNLNATNFQVFTQYVPVAPAVGSDPDTGLPTCISYNTTSTGLNQGLFNAPANGACAAGSVESGPVSITGAAFQNFQNFVQSVDYDISGHDKLRGRFVWNKVDQLDVNANLPAFYLVEPFRYYLATVSHFHTFSPEVLNEFRAGFNRFYNVVPTGDFAYPGLDSFPNLVFNDLGGGLNVGPDGNGPQFTYQNLYQFVDNLSWTKGAHTLKFGGEYRWYISPQSFTQRQRGDYEWDHTQLFMEDFAPDSFGERSSGSITYYGNQKAVYAHVSDTWKVDQHVTLNLGLRYEYTTNPTGERLQALNQISNTPGLIVPGVRQPFIFPVPEPQRNNWAPRVGLAFSPGSSGNTSIRAGFGMAYDVLYDNIGILAVPPQVGATFDVDTGVAATPNFLASGGLPGGGTGLSQLDEATARASTSNWIPPKTKWPYSINWNLSIQRSFGRDFTAEVRYVGTRGVHLDVQSRIDRRARITPNAFLPTYLQAPSQAQLDALPLTLGDLTAISSLVPAFSDAGFASSITSDMPLGSSIYHGLQTELSKRFNRGLMFKASYTWSRTIDDSTADFFTTYLTPRRPQDFQNWAAERSVSPLSRTHRFTLAAVYDFQPFRNSNWLLKNIVGNWGFSPLYTYESPQWANALSGLDSNLNGDFAGDRTVINPSGARGIGSDATPLLNSGGLSCAADDTDCLTAHTVAYVATNPNAYYIVAGAGALATGTRNTLATQPTNDFSLSTYKDVSITERIKFRIGAQFANIVNHPQFIPGSNPGQGLGVNDVNSFTTSSQNYLSFVSAGDPNFNKPKTVFASNARTIGIVARLTF